MELSARYAVRNIAEGQTFLRAQALLALQLLTLVGNIACLLLRVDNMELVAGCRRSVQTKDDGRL